MKYQMQKIIVISALMVAATGRSQLVFAESATDVGPLSPTWFQLPEDANSSVDSSVDSSGSLPSQQRLSRLSSRDDHGFDGLERLLSANASSFNGMNESVGNGQRPANAPSNWAPWHPENLILDLGVSVQGSLGVVVAGGSVAASVYWRHKKPGQALHPVEGAPADLVFNSAMSRGDIGAQIAPIVNALVATGRVKDAEATRDGLARYLTDLQFLMTGMESVAQGHWTFSKLRSDVTISGSGMVQPGFTVGGAANLRFEWVPVAHAYDAGSWVTKTGSDDELRRQNLREFLSAMVVDLDTVGEENWAGSGFKLDQFALGIGLFGKVNFGVATGSLAVMGRVYFKRVAALLTPSLKNLSSLDPKFGYMTTVISKRHIDFANRNGIHYSKESSGDTEWINYAIDRVKFRAGLAKAALFSTALAERAERHSGGRWEVFQIEPAFALSISGTVGIVTIGGKVAMNLILVRSVL